jgi:hypothetical protein
MDPIYDDSAGCGVKGLTRDRAKKYAKIGATTVGVLSVVPAAVCGTSVTLVTTGTVTSTNTIVTGILAGVATFGLIAGAGVAVGAGVGVAIGGLLSWNRRRKRDRELDLLINGEFV